MKKLEFESNGSKWGLICQDSFDGCVEEYCGVNGHKVIGSLKDITKEQASEVVDWNDEKQFYYKYPHTDWQGDISAIESLHSLLKSKGVYLYNNPIKDIELSFGYKRDAESKTFYNPILFKILS